MSHNYSCTVQYSEEDGVWIASVPEFRYCQAHGDTAEEAVAEAQVAAALLAETLIAEGDSPPEGRLRKEYSGRFQVRLPKTTHRRLAELALLEGCSLNALTTTLITEGMCRREVPPVARRGNARLASAKGGHLQLVNAG